MANLNKVMLIGRLTRDPEVRAFSNGGKVAKFGFAVNNRRKNTASGEWEDDPVFLDVDAFNRGERGTLADRVEQYLRKGQQVFIEGHLKLEQWTSKEGEKRSKISVVVDNFEFLEARRDASAGDSGQRYSSGSGSARQASPSPSPSYDEQYADQEANGLPPTPSRNEDDIPF